MDNSVGAEYGSEDPPGPDADGRVGGLFCQLHATRYSGEVYIESGEHQVTLVFHGGNPIFAEDVSGGGALSTEFVEAGLITNADFVELTSELDAVGSCLDMMFCSRAVELGKIPSAKATEIAMDWVRKHVMSALKWDDCYVDLDDSVVAPAAIHSWAQPMGPLVYLGVRTFYGRDAVDRAMGDEAQSAVEFLLPVQAAVEFFSLDEDEERLLTACYPATNVQSMLQLSELDELHTWQLLLLLRQAGLIELSAFGSSVADAADPFAEAAERQSQANSMPAPVDPFASATERHSQVGQLPTAPGDPLAAASERQSQVGQLPTSPDGKPAGGYRHRGAAKASEGSTPPARSSRPGRQASAADVPARAARSSTATGKRTARSSPEDAVARLNRQLGRGRPVKAKAAAKSGAAKSPRKTGDQHLKDLVRRRMARKQAHTAPSESLDAVAYFSRAKSALKKQTFDKAVEHMSKAVAADPESEIFAAYLMWAQIRSDPTTPKETAVKLRGVLRHFVSDGDHKAFALHASGHLAYMDGHDDKAEKFLRKAVDEDGKNMDAERYLRILEGRRAAKAKEPQKIFGIEISGRVGKK